MQATDNYDICVSLTLSWETPKTPISTTLQCVSVSVLIRYFGQFDLNAVKRFNRIRSSYEIVLAPLFLIGEWIIGMKEAKPWKNKRN